MKSIDYSKIVEKYCSEYGINDDTTEMIVGNIIDDIHNKINDGYIIVHNNNNKITFEREIDMGNKLNNEFDIIILNNTNDQIIDDDVIDDWLGEILTDYVKDEIDQQIIVEIKNM